jgi:hypothetical protein
MRHAPTSLIAALLVVGSLLPVSGRQAQPAGAAVVSTTTTRTQTDARLGLTVAATDVELPMGQWEIAGVAPAGAIDQLYVIAHLSPEDVLGRRSLAGQTQQLVATAQWRIQSLFEPIVHYASTHKGIGPRTFGEIDRQFAPLLVDVLAPPWGEGTSPGSPPYLFLVPATPVVPPSVQAPAARRAPLVVELRPYADDGRHWVLFSDGAIERVPIDQAFVAKYTLTIRPVQGGGTPSASADRSRVAHTLVGLRRAPGATAVTVTMTDAVSAARREIRWSLAGGKADSTLLREWASVRVAQWTTLAAQTQAPVLQAWIDRSAVLYGAESGLSSELLMMRNRGVMEGRSASTFDVLGGRAALRETLQMQLLRARTGEAAGGLPASIPVSSLTGVEVRGLPFEQMLAGRPGGRLPLADFAAEDRLFIHFAKPSAVFPFLDQGGDMIGRAGSTMTATAYDDNLKVRYLRRLGLPEASSRTLLESGAITEVALVAPDLFFIDGTDLTVLMRLRAPDASAAALALLGGVDVTASAIAEKRTAAGRSAYWARQGDVLAVSTNRAELETALRTGRGGAGSLGRSAELRYMLTEQPLRAETRAFIYLSDPFIRRMVGPAVKIGQLRRMRAAADMSMITAGALLYRLDGHQGVPDVATLAQLDYVPAGVVAGGYRLQPDLSVTSPAWGTLAELTTLAQSPVTLVTADEAEGYQTYVEEYRRYWRQYFDPIAIRLDDAPDGALELSTFVLPLVGSPLYNTLAGMIVTHDGTSPAPLRVPVITPDPVMQLSLNLSDASWVGLSSGWSESFSQYTGISPEIFDLLGPGLHIAVQDADPVISLGTADLLGAFGASTVGARMDMAIPFALSLLTRPCRIFIELHDAPRALALLRRAASAGAGGRREMAVSFRQVEGRDAWIYTMGVPGIATVRLGLEIQNGYLVFSNIPWSDPVTFDRVETRALNGAAIQVRPDAVRRGLASLFATQAEQDQTAALASMAALLPLLQTLSATPAEAAATHATLFGTMPVHPGSGGEWLWANGVLESSRYGSASRWRTPAFRPELGDFGLFNGATLLDLTMQLEQGGLRATARWRVR